MEDEFDDAPPSYQDVIAEQTRLKKNKELLSLTTLIFIILDILCSSLIGFLLFLLRFSRIVPVHKVNMTLYCDNPVYNFSPIPEQSNALAGLMVLFIVVIILIVAVIKFKVGKYNCDYIIRKVIMDIWSFLTHLLFLYVAIELIQLATGIPSPYYFANDQLQTFYCKSPEEIKPWSYTLEMLDHSFRTSFPSYRAATYAFCITFMYLYIDHYNIQIGIHAAEQTLLIILLPYVIHILIGYVENGENHPSDIIFGLIMGILQAMVTIRNIFGSLLFKRSCISLSSTYQFYNCDNGEPRNSIELQPLGQGQNESTEGDNTISTRCNICNPQYSRGMEDAFVASEQIVPNVTSDE